MAKDHIRYCGLVRGPHEKHHSKRIPNRLTYCVIFVAYTQFTNVAEGRGLETHDLVHMTSKNVHSGQEAVKKAKIQSNRNFEADY
jgi:hypothetical protein